MTARSGGDFRALMVWTLASALVAGLILGLDRVVRLDWPADLWPWVLMTLYGLWIAGPAASIVAFLRFLPGVGRVIGPGFLRFWGVTLVLAELGLAGIVIGVWLNSGGHGFNPLKLVSAFAVLLALVSAGTGAIYWGLAVALRAVPAACLRTDE